MALLEIRDGSVNCEITSDSNIFSLDSRVRGILHALDELYAAVAMSSYGIDRVGVTDVWNVSATSQDARAYTATVTLVGDVFVNTTTAFPQGTIEELRAFLDLVNTFTLILKSKNVSKVEITWT